MASWRDLVSARAQGDLDGLLDAVLPFAVQSLERYGEMYPYGASISADGELRMEAAAGSDERPATSELLSTLYAAARSSSRTNRAVAFVADVTVGGGGDAVRVELEHAEGLALVVVAPYSRDRSTGAVTLGQMSAARGETRIWT
jgi:hypothetical protein